jgi:hypothetical protein
MSGDVEDLELLVALVERGRDLVDLLDARQQTGYSGLELTRWVIEREGASPLIRARVVADNWSSAAHTMSETLWPGIADAADAELEDGNGPSDS